MKPRSTADLKWREIAWNGIRFSAPQGWEIAKLDSRYLMLEDGSEPVLELKWQPIKGRFSHEAQLKRLAAGKRQPAQGIRLISLPAGWDKALAYFEVKAFSWQTSPAQGIGVIAYCPECRTASLIRFYQQVSKKNKPIFCQLLESFQDHPPQNDIIWSLFDIRAVLPREFQLVQHRFNAGEYRLTFASKNQKIELYRWGPASILLRDRDLPRFAAIATPLPAVDPQALLEKGAPALEWHWAAPRLRWIRWNLRLGIGDACQRLRIWHLERANRILGVRLKGRIPCDSRLFDRICAAYESL